MKVRSNLKSGSWVDNAREAASDLGSQFSGFVSSAEQQAQGLAYSVGNSLSTLKQGFSDLLGLS